jgi:hypothetical protein
LERHDALPAWRHGHAKRDGVRRNAAVGVRVEREQRAGVDPDLLEHRRHVPVKARPAALAARANRLTPAPPSSSSPRCCRR